MSGRHADIRRALNVVDGVVADEEDGRRVDGKELPPAKLPAKDEVQQVLKPEPGRQPAKGGERPATA